MKKALILGFGSIGRKHYDVIKKLNKFASISVVTKSKVKKINKLKSRKQIIHYNPDYIIISTPTNEHIKNIKFIEKNFKKKIVLIEKPILGFFKNIKLKNNKYFVGYNLRMHPVINYIRNLIKKYDFWEMSIECSSYLPDWRRNIHYSRSSSAKRKNYGGVVRDLSHEIDYLYYLIGNFEIINFIKKKISNLKINTEDYFSFVGTYKKKKIINLKLSYLNKFHKREISILGPKLQLKASLTTNKIEYFINNKLRKISFNYSINRTYEDMHKNILNKKTKNLATVQSSLRVLKFIKKIEKK